MATALYLRLSGVTGECAVEGYEGWIDLLELSVGGIQTGTMHSGRGGGAGRVRMKDLEITKLCDQCSPDLLQKLCLGQHYDSVELHATKATGDAPLPYFTILLNHAIVTGMEFGGNGQNDMMTERLSLMYREITMEYRIQGEDGIQLGSTEAHYNVATGAT